MSAASCLAAASFTGIVPILEVSASRRQVKQQQQQQQQTQIFRNPGRGRLAVLNPVAMRPGGLHLFASKALRTCAAARRGLAVSCAHGASAPGGGSGGNGGGLQIELVPCLQDNYAYLLHDPRARVTGVVDPSEAAPVMAALEARGLKELHFVINTHHHWDHTGGNAELAKAFRSQVVGPAADRDRIPGITTALAEGDTWQFGGHSMRVFDTPGHTRGHVSFYFPDSGALFTGDTLFSLGCGRLFEGTPRQMWDSLSKLTALPPATRFFCGHEYTQSNAKFALHVEPTNEALQRMCQEITSKRQQGAPTVPSTLGAELAANPFLRPQSVEIRRRLGVSSAASNAEAFAAIRKAKDSF